MSTPTTTTTPPTALPRGPPDSSAVKARIISHMNADHQLSLRLYLMHYCHVPQAGTTSASLVDISPSHMILTSSYGRHVVAFEPEMKSLLEARERLVSMHQTCLTELDMSDVVVEGFVLPDRLWQWFVYPLVPLILATFPFRDQLKPESGSVIAWVWSLGGVAPGLARLCYAVAPAVLGIIVVSHGVEALWFANKKLRRHWVEFGSATWWFWVVFCLMEGSASFDRFGRVVKEKEEGKKGKGKH